MVGGQGIPISSHMQQAPLGVGGGGDLGEGVLHVSVRKLIKELTYNTCFEEADFERSHVALLAGVCVCVCLCVTALCLCVYKYTELA